jgi:hypothetical protein
MTRNIASRRLLMGFFTQKPAAVKKNIEIYQISPLFVAGVNL